MSGVYLEDLGAKAQPLLEMAGRILGRRLEGRAERFCDNDGGYSRRYNVYKLSSPKGEYVLKKSDSREVWVYEKLLRGRGFAVPECFGHTTEEGEVWLLLEHISGPDLRRFTREAAPAIAGTLSKIQNVFWGSGADPGRFLRYRERIEKRAACLRDLPELAKAYRAFLKRQESCPRTLNSGDLLQINCLLNKGKAYIIDWGFGGVMPYSLDPARLIAHGTREPEPDGFPFYMDDELRRTFLRAHYEGLIKKPGWDEYLFDITLSALNEYVEFLENDLKDPQMSGEEIRSGLYCRRAREAARIILER